MVALHDLRWNPLFSRQMICIGKTRGWGWCVVYKTNPLHTSPFWLNIVLDVPKLKITQAHIPYTYTSQIIFFDLFTFSVRVNNPWPNAICFVLFQNCHLVSLIVLVLQWMLKWSKRVSLRSVSFTNYPTLHHPLLSTFLFFFFFLHFYKFYTSPNITLYQGYKIKYIQNFSYTTRHKWYTVECAQNIARCSTLSLVTNNSLMDKFRVNYFQWWYTIPSYQGWQQFINTYKISDIKIHSRMCTQILLDVPHFH